MHSDTINITVVPTSGNKFDLKISNPEGEILEEYNELTLENMDYVINTKSTYIQVVQSDLIGKSHETTRSLLS